ncbi:MAG: DUF3820 family protein [Simkania negevensis]|nr:DUF3820 family protein [Simkania negevensis]
MGLLEKETFVCFDCEATGLDPKQDAIIEVALIKFTFEQVLASKEDLIDPGCSIPEHTIEIHHITDDMVRGKPKIQDVLKDYLKLIDEHIIVGHSVLFDISILSKAAENNKIPCHLFSSTYIDTLRLARLYGESPSNSLQTLRAHFNINPQGAHRAMSDVLINIEVFKYLSKKFKRTEEMLERLKKPILLKMMPLGKYKGRFFKEIPMEYLQWAVRQEFDLDLMFSLKTEIKKRKQGNLFHQAANPFSSL